MDCTLVVPSGSPRKRGRPPQVLTPARRKARIRLAFLVLSGALLIREAAAMEGVDRRTILRRIGDLLGDGEADTEGLRRLGHRR